MAAKILPLNTRLGGLMAALPFLDGRLLLLPTRKCPLARNFIIVLCDSKLYYVGYIFHSRPIKGRVGNWPAIGLPPGQEIGRKK